MKTNNFVSISTPNSDVQLHLPIPEAGEIYQEDSISSAISASGIPEIQESTHQVPCGEHSIFDPSHKVPAFARAIYLILNQHSCWDTGITHALSLRKLSELLNVKSHSQVHRGLKWLIANGWVQVEGKRNLDGAYFYKLTHHKCLPQETPVDKDGRPQKCAMPMGAGSPSQLLSDGEISWKVFVDWMTRKVHSDWTTGIVSMSVRQACKLMGFTSETIKANAEIMMDIGLMERMSKRFRRSVYQMYPKPYPDRRERTPEECLTKRAMKCIKGWYYSFNNKWRFERDTYRLQMRDGKTWLDTSFEKLLDINKSIHRDFCDYIRVLRSFHLAKSSADC